MFQENEEKNESVQPKQLITVVLISIQRSISCCQKFLDIFIHSNPLFEGANNSCILLAFFCSFR